MQQYVDNLERDGDKWTKQHHVEFEIWQGDFGWGWGGTYFAFLKRTGLAKDVCGIEDYQLLFPIPNTDVTDNVPQNNGLSIRHTTRNFENREGSKPGNGQLSAVALMDAKSIAATAKNNGAITSAMDLEYSSKIKKYRFNHYFS